MMRSVERILGVFESFAPGSDSLTLQEIADRIGLAKSTTFRIVRSLEQSGYLVRLENQHYCLSFRFTRLAGLVKSTLDIREISRPIMTELSAQTKETVSLHTVSGRDRVCIDVLNGTYALRSVSQPGEHLPLLVGSASKVLMAYMPPGELAPILAHIARSTKRTKAELMAELNLVAAQGFAVSHGERLLGVSAVSAPIMDVNEEVHYCLSVNGPSVRVRDKETEIVTQIVKAAASISLLNGARLRQVQKGAQARRHA